MFRLAREKEVLTEEINISKNIGRKNLVVVGLGNHKDKGYGDYVRGMYYETHHNMGEAVLIQYVNDINKWKCEDTYIFKDNPHKRRYYERNIVRQNRKIKFILPECPMNNSGVVINDILGDLVRRRKDGFNEEFDVSTDFLIVHDDMSLPVGTVRLRAGGSHGGHLGVNSCLKHLGCGQNISRIKVGIGVPHLDKLNKGQIRKFVLQKPSIYNRKILNESLVLACHVLNYWFRFGPVSKTFYVD